MVGVAVGVAVGPVVAVLVGVAVVGVGRLPQPPLVRLQTRRL